MTATIASEDRAADAGMRVTAVHVYPVKSMRGLAVPDGRVEPLGLAGDRRWMVTTPEGRFVTGRQLGRLAQCIATLTRTGLRLEIDDAAIDVATPTDAPARDVVVWHDEVTARDAGDAVADWLAARFGRPLRLVYQYDPRSRPIPPARRVTADDVVSFADGYPLLATTTGSLAELNSRLSTPVTAAHFRPNVVIDCAQPFDEDGWRTLSIGGVRFAAASACSRCVFTTVDPDSGARRSDGEPLATLGRYRRDPHTKKILFGVNLVPLDAGEIRVGDAVTVERAAA